MLAQYSLLLTLEIEIFSRADAFCVRLVAIIQWFVDLDIDHFVCLNFRVEGIASTWLVIHLKVLIVQLEPVVCAIHNLLPAIGNVGSLKIEAIAVTEKIGVGTIIKRMVQDY